MKYLNSFIRGLWDGDGSVFISKRKLCAIFTCGSKDFIDEFSKVLVGVVGLNKATVYRDKRRESAYFISLQPNDSRKLREYIYRDVTLCLKRKRNKFYEFGEISFSRNNCYSSSELKKIVGDNKIRSQRDFYLWAKKNKDKKISHSPNIVYKNNGWTNWYDFLGKIKGDNNENSVN